MTATAYKIPELKRLWCVLSQLQKDSTSAASLAIVASAASSLDPNSKALAAFAVPGSISERMALAVRWLASAWLL